MLYIEFHNKFTHKYPDDKILRKVDIYWKLHNKPGWIDNELCKRMIKDIDKSEVISDKVIDSPIFGSMSPASLSGGVLSLIIMYNTDAIVDFTNCGDNCVPWLIEISKLKDVYTVCEYLPWFPDGTYDVYVNGVLCHNRRDVMLAYLPVRNDYEDYVASLYGVDEDE